jgi:YD repeat-containing protein
MVGFQMSIAGRSTMPSCTFIAAAVFLAGAMTEIAQPKPDFSGEWKLNRQASTLSPIVAPAAQSGVLRIEHREPRFTSHLTIVLDGKPFESKFELLSDGREVATTDDRGRVSTLRWDGDALVATWRTQGPVAEVTISFRYELQDGGRRLRAAEQIRGGGRDQDNLWVFERP